jgi:hypothetical protein
MTHDIVYWFHILTAHTYPGKIKIQKTITLPTGLYGCETLSLYIREEHKYEYIWTYDRGSNEDDRKIA